MKKLVLSVLGVAVWLLATTPAFADARYQCYRYVDGKPTGGWIHVRANSKSEAETRALQRYRGELKLRTDSVNCHAD